jgi:biopolymer transport protein ExbD
MFLLLTFFIYIATAMVLQRGIPVDLAHAASGEPLTKEVKPISVFVRSSGELYLEETLVTEADLSSRLRALATAEAPKWSKSPRPVVVNADKGVLHEKVVEVLDLARESGVAQVILAVEPKTPRATNKEHTFGDGRERVSAPVDEARRAETPHATNEGRRPRSNEADSP